jgi:hypothetical protein
MTKRIRRHNASLVKEHSHTDLHEIQERRQKTSTSMHVHHQTNNHNDFDFVFRFENLIIIRICFFINENHYLHIHNLYNESNTSSNFALIDLRRVLTKNIIENFHSEHLIMRNFNIHHSVWDDLKTRTDNRFVDFINLMNEFHLTFNLLYETITYIHFQSFEFIIDLCLIIEALATRVLICQDRLNLNHNSNHALIETILNIFIINASFIERFNWSKLNLNKFNDTLNHEFLNQLMLITVTSLNNYAE